MSLIDASMAGTSGWAASGNCMMDYGARNDGSALATSAFAPRSTAKAAGGSTVYVPAGKNLTGPIELVKQFVLDIDAAVLSFKPASGSLVY